LERGEAVEADAPGVGVPSGAVLAPQVVSHDLAAVAAALEAGDELAVVPSAVGGIGLAAFFWSLRNRQYEDPQGDANRILTKDWDDHPKP
jgi:cbb3-type cytochrome oxidase maturation protein